MGDVEWADINDHALNCPIEQLYCDELIVPSDLNRPARCCGLPTGCVVYVWGRGVTRVGGATVSGPAHGDTQLGAKTGRRLEQ